MKRNIIKPKSKPGVKERMPMDGKDTVLELSCFNRYEFAGKYTEGKVVVDAACADGYGSKFLKAKKYIGLDYFQEALDKAKTLYKGEFKKTDLEKTVIPECDVLVCYETLEHLEDPIGFLERNKSKVKETIIISVPNNEEPGANQFHKWIFDENSFKEIIGKMFNNVEFYQQDDKIIGENIYPLWLIAVIKLS